MASRLEGSEGDRSSLPELVATLIESVARYMGATHGNAKLEFEFESGTLHRWNKHERGGRSDLERLAAEGS